jgi:HYDIN/CFA65/VesB-like, Ig-like domain
LCAIRRLLAAFLVWTLTVAGALFSAAPSLAQSVLAPSPATENFGGVDMHFQESMQENYTNESGSSTIVDSVSILGDASSFSLQRGQDFCTGSTIAAGDSCHVNVLFGPLSSPGPKTATLELTDTTGTVDVPLTGTGFSGTLSVNQSSLDFGSEVIANNNNNGGSQQESVTLAAGPDFGVRVTNVQVNGPDASSFSVQGNGCQGYILSTNSTCQIYIQFQPTSAGAKQAQLEIDNDGTVSPLFVSLSGVGLNGPALSVSPQQAIFGNIPLGSSTSQSFTLTNVGDAPLQFQELFIASGSPQVFPMSDGCSSQQLAPGAACQVTVGFIPIALGVKDAALFVLSNQRPVSIIGLSGTGVAPNPVASGPPGATGATGLAGRPGILELVTCNTATKTVTENVKGKKRKVKQKLQRCAGKLVSSTVKFTVTGASDQATISRGRVVYATGTSLPLGSGRSLLLLTEQRTLEHGGYTLTLRAHHGRRWSTSRATITIG